MTSATATAAAMEIEEPTGGAPRQWVQLLPAEEKIVLKDGRGPFYLRNASAVIRASAIERGLPVDFDHQIDRAAGAGGNTAPAAGWIVSLASRDDGLWGLVEWTAAGAEKIGDRQYRFISPVFAYDPGTKEILRIDRAGLTNNPAITALQAVASSEDASGDTGIGKRYEVLRAFVVEEFNLDQNADDDALMEAIKARLAEDAKAPADPPREEGLAKATMQIAGIVSELNAERIAERNEVAIVQASAQGKLPPCLHDWARELCAVSPGLFATYVANTAPIIAAGEIIPSGMPPDARITTASAQGAEAVICTQLNVKPEDLR